MKYYRLSLAMEPVPAPRPCFNRHGRVYYPKRYSAFKVEAAQKVEAAVMGLDVPLRGPLLVVVHVAPMRPKTTKLRVPKPDVDNYAKAVLDACNGLLWDDDEQVIALLVTKSWAPLGEAGAIEIAVKEHDPEHDLRRAFELDMSSTRTMPKHGMYQQ